MNLFILLYVALLSAVETEVQKPQPAQPNLTFNKLVKPADQPIEESSVYHHAPTEWIKISKKI